MNSSKIFGKTFDDNRSVVKKKISNLVYESLISDDGILERDMCKLTRADIWSYIFYVWDTNKEVPFFGEFFRHGQLSHLSLISYMMKQIKNGETADPEEVFSESNMIDFVNDVIRENQSDINIPIIQETLRRGEPLSPIASKNSSQTLVRNIFDNDKFPKNTNNDTQIFSVDGFRSNKILDVDQSNPEQVDNVRTNNNFKQEPFKRWSKYPENNNRYRRREDRYNNRRNFNRFSNNNRDEWKDKSPGAQQNIPESYHIDKRAQDAKPLSNEQDNSSEPEKEVVDFGFDTRERGKSATDKPFDDILSARDIDADDDATNTEDILNQSMNVKADMSPINAHNTTQSDTNDNHFNEDIVANADSDGPAESEFLGNIDDNDDNDDYSDDDDDDIDNDDNNEDNDEDNDGLKQYQPNNDDLYGGNYDNAFIQYGGMIVNTVGSLFENFKKLIGIQDHELRQDILGSNLLHSNGQQVLFSSNNSLHHTEMLHNMNSNTTSNVMILSSNAVITPHRAAAVDSVNPNESLGLMSQFSGSTSLVLDDYSKTGQSPIIEDKSLQS